MSFKCPHIGTKEANEKCEREFLSVMGLKKHLTRQHGKWTPEQISSALNSNGSSYESIPETRPAESTLPIQDAARDSSSDSHTVDPRTTPRQPKAPAEGKGKKAQVRMTNALGKFKEEIAQMIPQAYVSFIRNKVGYSGNVNQKSTEALGELWGAYLDLLGFDVEAEPVKFRLSGKLLFFVFPVLMLPVTFFMLGDRQKVEPPSAEVSDGNKV